MPLYKWKVTSKFASIPFNPQFTSKFASTPFNPPFSYVRVSAVVRSFLLFQIIFSNNTFHLFSFASQYQVCHCQRVDLETFVTEQTHSCPTSIVNQIILKSVHLKE